MPDDSTACRMIVDELRRINERMDDMSAAIARLEHHASMSDGERGALAKIGAGVLALATVLIAAAANWGKITGHSD